MRPDDPLDTFRVILAAILGGVLLWLALAALVLVIR